MTGVPNALTGEYLYLLLASDEVELSPQEGNDDGPKRLSGSNAKSRARESDEGEEEAPCQFRSYQRLIYWARRSS
jgi:hypothetical protein